MEGSRALAATEPAGKSGFWIQVMLQEGDVVWIPLPWETRPTIKNEGGTQSQDWSIGEVG